MFAGSMETQVVKVSISPSAVPGSATAKPQRRGSNR